MAPIAWVGWLEQRGFLEGDILLDQSAGILPSCGMEDRPVTSSLFPTLSTRAPVRLFPALLKRRQSLFQTWCCEAETHAVDSHARSEGLGWEHITALDLSACSVPQVKQGVYFNNSLENTSIKVGPAFGEGSYKAKDGEEGATGRGSRMDKKGEARLNPGRSLPEAMQGRCAPGTPTQARCVLSVPRSEFRTTSASSLQQKKGSSFRKITKAGIPAPHQP